jgi:hypothetical protein
MEFCSEFMVCQVLRPDIKEGGVVDASNNNFIERLSSKLESEH